MARKTRRIYYGPEGHETSMFWRVTVSDARHAVTVNGSVIHALKGHPGMTVGCGLSNAACDKRNVSSFPHPVYLAAFTKSGALIVDRLNKAGAPCHAIRYSHSYGRITDKNDDGTLKRLVKDDPSIMERPFVLRPPRPSDTRRKERAESNPAGGPAAPNQANIARGALARAVKAGRIGKNVAAQLTEVAENMGG